MAGFTAVDFKIGELAEPLADSVAGAFTRIPRGRDEN
jgi:hypothetical protein